MHGRLPLTPERIDLGALAEQAVEDIRIAAGERELSLHLEPPGEPLPICADPARIRQVIGNLLSNALKFTDPGGSITVCGRREGGEAVLAVQDTGRGMPPELLPTLFRPFRQYGRTEITAGLGLGLALVKGIVETEGGSVSAASPGLGQGSTFTVRLPLAEGERG